LNAYSRSVRYLYGLEVFGMKFGLKGIQTLLSTVGNPHRNFPTIHIAGTNGKGSTSSMLAAIFTAAGYRTGLYTSPHLISFTERIRVNGRPIPRKDVVRLTNLIKNQVNKQKATYFEAVTAIAFKYFSDAKLDIAIIETGLGGRLDATNVVRPLVSVITNVSLEHTEILGKTIRKIAWEKAGIIKTAVPCVTGISASIPLDVLRRMAAKRKASLHTTRSMTIKIRKSSFDGLLVDANVGDRRFRNLLISLAGRHQAKNVKVVLRTLAVIGANETFHIEERHIRNGLKNIQRLAGLEARLCVIHRHPLIIGDVAHNPDSIKKLVESLRDLGIRNVFLVFGVVRDKDYGRMIHFLKPITQKAILTKARTERARSVEDLAFEFERQKIDVFRTEQTVSRAVSAALAASATRVPILITGSHFTVGEALKYLRSRKFT
jgi:dihydrofolate synthase / folylpolyglutamate synthase